MIDSDLYDKNGRQTSAVFYAGYRVIGRFYYNIDYHKSDVSFFGLKLFKPKNSYPVLTSFFNDFAYSIVVLL